MWVNHSLLTIRYTLFIRCGAQRYHSSRSAGQRAQACARVATTVLNLFNRRYGCHSKKP
jgi:hypothetical protein